MIANSDVDLLYTQKCLSASSSLLRHFPAKKQKEAEP